MKNLLFALAVALELTYISASAIVPRSSSKTSCGVLGYDQGAESFYGSSEGTYTACSARCLQYSTCSMFAVGAGECQLYDSTIKQNWVLVSDSPYAAYDRACISTTSTTSAPTTTKSGTTTAKVTATTKTSVTTSTSAIKTTTTSTTSAKAATTTTTTVFKTTSSSMKTSTTSAKATTSPTSAKTTSSTATSVQTVAATSTTSTQAASSFICGEQGTFMKGSVSISTYDTNYGEMTQEALTECYNYCQASYPCFSWTWSPNSCTTWHSDTSHFQATTSWYYYVWDKNCPAPAVSDAIHTTTTTTSVSTTQPTAAYTKC